MTASAPMEIEVNEYAGLLEAIRFTYGYDFTEYAESAVKRRIGQFMRRKKIESVDELGRVVLNDEALFEEFVQGLSVTVTEMFRDPGFYQSIRERLSKRLATYPVVKIWIAGCATGEEVYSLAILLKEEDLLEKTIIYATDINQKSLETAMNGIYPLERIEKYAKNYSASGGKSKLTDYYTASCDSVVFHKSLKKNVVFSPHNLAMDKSFNEFQLIICRNVMIYFKQQLQSKVISLFYESLCHFGFLGLGDKESLLFSDKKDHFEETHRKEKIYMKIK